MKSGQHVTDVTNASRTLLMNLHTLQWDDVSIIFYQLNLFANHTNHADHWFDIFYLVKVMHYFFETMLLLTVHPKAISYCFTAIFRLFVAFLF